MSLFSGALVGLTCVLAAYLLQHDFLPSGQRTLVDSTGASVTVSLNNRDTNTVSECPLERRRLRT